MALNQRKVEKALLRKGFRRSSTNRSSDHKYFDLYVSGKKTGIYTKTSHGSKVKDIPKWLESEIAEQMKLSKDELLKFVSCFIGEDEYKEIALKRYMESTDYIN